MEALLDIRQALVCRGSATAGFRLRVGSFSLAAGEFVAILGPSGCGKSTLLDTLGLALRPERADTFAFRPKAGLPVHALQRLGDSELAALRRRHFGYVLQSGGLFSSLSVRQNIETSIDFSGKRRDSIGFARLIECLGLEKLMHRLPRELSGGQRQRVAIARALAHRPDVVLADEPTAAVDHRIAADVCQALRACAREQGSAVAMVTHNQLLAQDFADRIVDIADWADDNIMREGRKG